ncbi:MAG TPA: UPF0175 family protein [Gemmataceae bacterium]|jgi:hypothetical protein|nr:UPF0175 family protein [Gemmataceae bacterium]
MAITFELPTSIEQQLRGEWADFDAVAKEAALVELYRQAKLTHFQLATALGLDRFATDELLKRHQVTEDLQSAEMLGSQIAALRKLVDQ